MGQKNERARQPKVARTQRAPLRRPWLGCAHWRGRRGGRGGMLAALAAALSILSGCGGDEPPAPDTSNEDVTQDFTTFDVEWRDDAVIIDDMASVQSSLVSADHELGRFVFTPELSGLARLQIGSAVLIGGVGIFRVLARASTDEGEQLDVEPALLTDVIENGSIAWRRSFITSPDDAKIGLGLNEDEDEAETIRQLQQPLGAYQNGKLEHTGTIAGFDTTFRLERNSGALDFALTAKNTGGAVGNAAISGTVRGLTNETNIEIDAQTLTLFTVRFLNVEGEIKIEAGGVELGLFDRKIQIPARLSLPVTVYGIPFRIDLGAGLEWASTLTANTSAIFDGAVKFKGGVGARIQDGEVDYLATFDTSEVTLGKREHVGTVTAGMGILLNFPEIGFGIGYPRAIDASASFKFKSEVLSNFALRYESAGPVPVITGNCMTSRANFGATVVGKVSAIGITVAEEEVALFSKLGQEQKSGNACED
jgi:hypothetical protein